ncbi:hypothetical protein DIPPA_35438 [Diplonema papillatum]|nr:hypothetical protein DIPPA_35438 [Diplonema papillatum]
MACQDPKGGGFFSRKTFPIYTASELKRKIAEKERRGADDVASRLRADGRHVPHIEPIDERAERSLRLTACAFIWDCGNTGRMSVEACCEAALNEAYSAAVAEGHLFCAFDKRGSADVARRVKARRGPCSAYVPFIGGPTAAEVAGSEKALSALVRRPVTARSYREALGGLPQDSEAGARQHVATLQRHVSALKDASFPDHPAHALSTARAVYLFQHFFLEESFRAFDRFLVATACLFLAFKTDELLPLPGVSMIESAEYALKTMLPDRFAGRPSVQSDILRLEMSVLKTLGFELDCQTPHEALASLFTAFKPTPPVRRLAAAACNDALVATDLALRYAPETLATAALCFAAAAAPAGSFAGSPAPAISPLALALDSEVGAAAFLAAPAAAVRSVFLPRRPPQAAGGGVCPAFREAAAAAAAAGGGDGGGGGGGRSEAPAFSLEHALSDVVVRAAWADVLRVYAPLFRAGGGDPPAPSPLVQKPNSRRRTVADRYARWAAALKHNIRTQALQAAGESKAKLPAL